MKEIGEVVLRDDDRRRAALTLARPPACILAAFAAGTVLAALVGCSHQNGSATTSIHSESEPARVVNVGGQPTIQLDPESLKLAMLTTVRAEVQDLRQSVRPTGQVTATDTDSAQVTSRLPGRITDALVSVGSVVHKGQLIANVDSVDLSQAEANYQSALSHERLAFNQLQQQRRLAGYGALSEQPVEDARRAYGAAQAAVAGDEAQLRLDRVALSNVNQLVSMGEITHKPVEDAQNAFAQTQSALIQARVTRQSTKANLDRAKVLYAGGVFSKQQLEDAETAFNNAVAAVEQDTTQKTLAAAELARQQRIYKQNLNGASASQAARSKLQQDEHTYQNDLTSLEVTRKELARAQIIHRSGIPISQALQQAQDAYQEARVAVQGAANTLKLYGVTPGQSTVQLVNGHVIVPVLAPMAGIVTARNMVVGQIIDATTALVKIVNLDRVYVDAQIYEKDLPNVTVGDPIQIQTSAFPDRIFAGRVHYVGNEVNPDTRTITVRTIIPNPGWLLRPGMFVTVLIGSLRATRAVSVPSEAVLQAGNDQVVFVQVAPNQFQKRVVKVGRTINDKVAVLGGILPGDRVVVGGAVLIQQAEEKLQGQKGASHD